MKKENTDKISEKAFIRLMITSALIVFISLVCLCSTTWAWFSSDLASGTNTIQSAGRCLLTITVEDDGTALTETENGVELLAENEYIVTLSLPRNSSSGYCLIVVDTEQYYSEYIARHDDTEPKTLSFTLTVENTCTVKFIPRWGIYAGESCVQNGALHIV